MFERFDDTAHEAMDLAGRESDRLHHNYLGGEHLLVAIAEQGSKPAALVLSAQRLDATSLRAEVDHLIAAGVLPPPWQNDADLLRGVGVDLEQVARAMRETFGEDAVDEAVRQVSRRSGWTPLCGKALLAKQAFSLAAREADALGAPGIGAEHLLLGVLLDAGDPLDKPRCYRHGWQRRFRGRLGLPHRGPSPVRLMVEARGVNLVALQDEIARQLRSAA